MPVKIGFRSSPMALATRRLGLHKIVINSSVKFMLALSEFWTAQTISFVWLHILPYLRFQFI